MKRVKLLSVLVSVVLLTFIWSPATSMRFDVYATETQASQQASQGEAIVVKSDQPSPALLATFESLLRALSSQSIKDLDLSHVSDEFKLKTSLQAMFQHWASSPPASGSGSTTFETTQFDDLVITKLKRGLTRYTYAWSEVRVSPKAPKSKGICYGSFLVRDTKDGFTVVDWQTGDLGFMGVRFSMLDQIEGQSLPPIAPPERKVSPDSVKVARVRTAQPIEMSADHERVLHHALSLLACFELGCPTLPESSLKDITGLTAEPLEPFFALYAALRHKVSLQVNGQDGWKAPRLLRSELKDITITSDDVLIKNRDVNEYIYDAVWSYDILDKGVITTHEKAFTMRAVQQKSAHTIALGPIHLDDMDYLRCYYAPLHLKRALDAHDIKWQTVLRDYGLDEEAPFPVSGVVNPEKTTTPTLAPGD